MKTSLHPLGTIIAIIVVVILALSDIRSPQSKPESADPAYFSSARAMKHLRVIAVEPRFVGSPSHQRTKEYLLQQLRLLGFNPVIQKTMVRSASRVSCIENVLVTIRGRDNTKAVLLAAHYDTVPLAPGANDAGSGVVSMLESIRALQHHPPLRNDLIILFTDSEEMGLFGAKAFMEESPISDSIGFVMNFEARGSSGPSIMFETSEENGWVVREFDRVIPSKFSSSLLYELYRLLPNNTDFTILKRKGASGLNFAHANSAIDYHTVNDNLSHVDERTIQHHGENMLSCLLHFGNVDLGNTRGPNLVYFSFLLGSFIMYPASWSIPLVCVTTALFGLILFLGLKRKDLSLLNIGLGFLLFLARVVLAAGIIFGLWRLLGPLHPEFQMFYLDSMYQADTYLIAFLAFAATVAFLLHDRFEKKLGRMNLAIGAALLWLILSWVLTLLAPAASYIVVWPLSFTLIGYLILLLGKYEDLTSTWIVAVLVICMIPGVFIATQLLYLLYHMMTLFVAAALAGLLVLFIGLLQMQVSMFIERYSWLFPLTGTGITIVCILLALFSRAPSEQHPKPNSLFYAVDLNDQTAVWATWDSRLDEWTSRSIKGKIENVPLPRYFLFSKTAFLSSAAPYTQLAGPEATLLDERVLDSMRVLRIQIRLPRIASMLAIEAETPDIVYQVAVNKRSLDSLSQRTPIRWPKICFGMAGESVELEVTVKKEPRFGMRLFTVSQELQDEVKKIFPARPVWMIPRSALITDASIVGKSFEF
ncbi:MAG: M20/M25/M40 family metallo-hydrolase [bacterium]